MGCIIVCTTLVLGVIAMVAPFEIADMSPFLITRAFTIITAIAFLIFVRTGRKISKLEGLFFLSIYVLFLLVEIFLPNIIK
jgi:Ca2+/Na+ antiporter